ncbi:helix-turn-helix domain-containing protein [Chryseobacterium sp. YIM B08800]|uniref:helix-turn-helix domain-containing protein n=1 Tax=Chryseobacterium sp. YIM B08800 TaxID=2984136 RepID=UPI0022403144|nr:helix-turn-helix domain-containing protein [Chryseobacterium sp. YIM B08800]
MQIDLDSFGQFIQKLVREELEKFNKGNHNLENEKQFYTREETAKLLDVSLTTLFHWNNQGILKAKKIGKRVYYCKSDVQAHLKS